MKKLAAGTSAAALVLTGLSASAGLANAEETEAQDPAVVEEVSGALSSSSLDIDTKKLAADLDLAIAALDGPVAVEGRDGAGPLVSYTNRAEGDDAPTLRCIGFTMPYSTVEKAGLDPNALSDSGLLEAYGIINKIEKEGNVSLL